MKWLLLAMMLLTVNAHAATEFISKINCGTDSCSGAEDYANIADWEDAMDNVGDLTASDVLVFSISSETGTVNDGDAVTGDTSGATGTVIHVNEAQDQVLIDAISGTFLSGENVEVDVSNYVVLSDAGDSAIVTAEIYDDDGDINRSSNLEISGMTTSSTNYLKITVPVGERHNGTHSSGAKLDIVGTQHGVVLNMNYTVIEWLVIEHSPTGGSNVGGIDIRSSNNKMRNLIMYYAGSSGGTTHLIRNRTGSTQHVLNCILFNARDRGIHNESFSNPSIQILNTTIYNTGDQGIRFVDTTNNGVIKNTLVIDSGGSDFAVGNATTVTNGSSDTTGSAGLQNLTAANLFTNITGGSEDLHLKTGATAIDAGTDLGTTPTNVQYDIDNRDRDAQGDTWDVGADEFVSGAAPTTRRVIFVQ
jgi:hypothetical protein